MFVTAGDSSLWMTVCKGRAVQTDPNWVTVAPGAAAPVGRVAITGDEGYAMTGKAWSGWAAAIGMGLALVVLGGCSTLSEEECLSGDWRTIGFEDGVAGRAMSRLTEHREACADYGVAPDLDAYTMGRDEGLRAYCQEANGFDVGARGLRYGGVCPPDLEDDFLAAYRDGRELYSLEQEVERVEDEIGEIENRMRDVEDSIRDKERELDGDELASDERRRLRRRIRELDDELRDLRSDLFDLERERDERRYEVEDFRRSVFY